MRVEGVGPRNQGFGLRGLGLGVGGGLGFGCWGSGVQFQEPGAREFRLGLGA